MSSEDFRRIRTFGTNIITIDTSNFEVQIVSKNQ